MDKQKIVVGLAIVICVSFFLPWITVKSGAVGGVTKALTGKKQEVLDRISGFDVPVMANSKESRFMISVIKVLQPGITNADKKSYLIWLVPLLSVAMCVVSQKYRNKWTLLAIGVVGTLIFVGGTFKIFTTDLDKLVLKVSISYGLWLTFLGYLGIGIIHLLDFKEQIKKA